MSLIYSPSNDTNLMLKSLKLIVPKLINKNPDLKILEMGCGSGFLLEEILKLKVKKENLFAVDINLEAVEFCLKKGFQVIQSNLFSKIKNKKYDLIYFNPPYLPLDKLEDKESRLATTGGKSGEEIINRFLKQANNYLNKNGRILLLTSSLAPKINFQKFKTKLISQENLFFEKLFVWELVL
jgi:release factor glutamine methyltransferase